MKKLLILPILLLLFIVTSCSGGSDEVVITPPANDVTYNGDISPIISGSCLTCHTDPPVNNAPMSLTTLQNVKDAITGRGLIGRIANGSMPAVGNPLSAAQVQKFRDWETGGFKQ